MSLNLAESFISGLSISNFLAVHGVIVTFTILLGSIFAFLAKYVLIVTPCIEIGLLAVDKLFNNSG